MLPFTEEDFDARLASSAVSCFRHSRDAKVEEGFNGIFSFTPDGVLAHRASHRDLAGFWVAEAVWVTHSAGVAKAVAECIVDGTPSSRPARVRPAPLRRLQRAARRTSRRPSAQDFVEVYDVIHPLQHRSVAARPADQPVPRPPGGAGRLLLRGRRLGAPALVRGQRRTAGATLPAEWTGLSASATTGRRGSGRRSRWPRRGATREHVAMYDMTPLTRVRGRAARARRAPAAADHQRRRQDRRLGDLHPAARRDRRHPQRPHRRPAGRDRFQVGANAPLDLDWLTRQLPADGSVAGPRHHRRHLLHRGVGAAGPRPGAAAVPDDDLSQRGPSSTSGRCRPTSAPSRSP